jgi:heme/copper-type cytochrome/quinol oxidase subunit 2
MFNNKPQMPNNNKSKKISSQLEISSFTFMTVFLGVVIMLLIFFSMIINNMKVRKLYEIEEDTSDINNNDIKPTTCFTIPALPSPIM